MIEFTTCDTPLGPLHLAMEGTALVQVHIQSERHPSPPPAEWVRNDRKLKLAAKEVAAYFSGQLKRFQIELAPPGTEFQRKTWAALSLVPYGDTVTYAALAQTAGSPGASRAVGLAMRTNPLALILPCHRVVGSNGQLTGYAHGIEMKRNLLEFERSNRKANSKLTWAQVAPRFGAPETKSLFPG